MKKTIKDFDLKNKKVIIRVDFNVPIVDGKITDDKRIKESVKTINYAIDNDAKVILLSHLGRVEKEEDKKDKSLKLVAIRLEEILNTKIKFVDKTRGKELEDEINNLKNKEILLMENTRFEDLNGKLESKNDQELSRYWASLGDIFINDAFGTCHRAHASNVGIASNLPSGIGFLVEKELKELNLDEAKKPLTILIGGSKVSSKINLIENLVNVADYILIGGAMAYTFLKASDINVGSSIVDEENIDFCKKILDKYKDKIILPIDSVVSSDMKTTRECFINEIKENEIGYDIGHSTIKLFANYLEESKTIIWNGPVGMFENEKFNKGTIGILEVLKRIDAKKIAGGGDTASAIANLGYEDVFDHISTGGGASLELLEGKSLPGVEVIDEKENN